MVIMLISGDFNCRYPTLCTKQQTAAGAVYKRSVANVLSCRQCCAVMTEIESFILSLLHARDANILSIASIT